MQMAENYKKKQKMFTAASECDIIIVRGIVHGIVHGIVQGIVQGIVPAQVF